MKIAEQSPSGLLENTKVKPSSDNDQPPARCRSLQLGAFVKAIRRQTIYTRSAENTSVETHDRDEDELVKMTTGQPGLFLKSAQWSILHTTITVRNGRRGLPA